MFFVDTTKHTLSCTVYANNDNTGATAPGALAAPLVSNVSSMDVLYAVDTGGKGSADKYLTADLLTTTTWKAVKAVRITLNFINPNAAAGSATIPWVQTINLMNNK